MWYVRDAIFGASMNCSGCLKSKRYDRCPEIPIMTALFIWIRPDGMICQANGWARAFLGLEICQEGYVSERRHLDSYRDKEHHRGMS